MLTTIQDSPHLAPLIWSAFDPMPNFGDHLQTNNVLLRRIMKLKVEKGFNINQEEADGQVQGLKYYESSVSAALSSNKPSALAGLGIGEVGNDVVGLPLPGGLEKKHKVEVKNVE